MIIKNSAKLQKKHPNYANEIGIIREAVDCCVAVVSTDLMETAQCIGDIDWNINIKNFFLSSQPKEIHCEDINMNNKGFYELYDKTGFKFTTSVNHPVLLNVITSSQAFDYMNIFQQFNLYTISFRKEGVYNGRVEIESQNGNPVLLAYDITIQ